MENKATSIVDEYLESLNGIEMAKPNNQFYTHLINRLKNHTSEEQNWNFPLKPVWMITCLAVFLILNIIVLMPHQVSQKKQSNTTVESFATAYDQNITSFY